MKANLPPAIARIISALLAGAVLSGWLSPSARAATGVRLSDVAPVGRIAAFARPIVWVDEQRPPANEDTTALASAVRVWLAQGEVTGEEAMELFVSTYTNSAWLPSLESQLGKYYREHGRYTLALQHWAAAWAVTKDAADGPAKEVADFTLAFYTRLLAIKGSV